MRQGSVLLDGRRRAALVDGDRVWVGPDGGLDRLIAAGAAPRPGQGQPLALAEAVFDAPLRPPVVYCVGQNYRDHLDEKAPVHRDEPEFFLKAGQTIAGPDQPTVLDPRVTAKLDYETELGVVIGRGGRHIAQRNAFEHVHGYLVVNDVTARDRQVKVRPDGSQSMSLGPGKNFDGATRLGPLVVTADDVPDPHALTLTTTVNGEVRQLNSTKNLISTIQEIIAFVSTLVTLSPGDVIATGTPGGTGWGTDPDLGGTGRTPPGCVPARYLTAGDQVHCAIGDLAPCEFTVAPP
jgi:2-keto-4-pentenoate hydratase/2-oxohepta-3-ene-1,7-dioic acid hydratase in catechol pathway